MKYTIKIKILIIVTVVTVFAVGTIITASARLSAIDYQDALQSRSLAIAKSLTIQLERLLQLGLRIDDIVGFEEQCQEVVHTYSGIDLALVTDRNGSVVFQSRQNPPVLSVAIKEAVVAAKEGILTQTINGTTWHYAIVPAFTPNRQHVASIVISFPANLVTNKISRTLFIDFWIGVLLLFFGLIFLYAFLAKYVTGPLSDLISTVSNLGQNPLEFAKTAKIKTSDEIGQLSKAFNQLVSDLQNTTVSKSELEAAMTELKRLSTALQEQKDQVEVTLQAIGDAVISVNIDCQILYLNPAAEKLCGMGLPEAEGLPLYEVLQLQDLDSKEELPDPFEKAFSGDNETSSQHEANLLDKNGNIVAVNFIASPIHDMNGIISGGVLTLRDVSNERDMAERLSWEATRDALTGLVNRREFSDRLEQAIQSAQKNQNTHTLCFMDLDHFKMVNDSAGHTGGDQLLKILSKLLDAQLRSSDTLSRFGGDEFALLLEGCDVKEAENISNKLLKVVRNFRFECNKRIFTIGVSIGIAKIDGTSNSNEVLTMADTACYIAKEQGRNQIRIFDHEGSEGIERKRQADWATKINSGLNEDQFILYYQSCSPLFLFEEKRRQIEVLLRLQDEGNKLVFPEQFLPAAERYGLAHKIDHWVIQQVFSNYHKIVKNQNNQALTCFINLSGASLNTPGFLEFIRNQVHKYKIPKKSICFEITESCAMSNLDKVYELIKECKSLGILFALDDFGKGASSLSYLKSLSIDLLKIDGCFINNITKSKIDKVMIEAINRIGHIMGIRTVAEHAENQETIDALRDIGVDYAQGFEIHTPEPLFPRVQKKASGTVRH